MPERALKEAEPEEVSKGIPSPRFLWSLVAWGVYPRQLKIVYPKRHQEATMGKAAGN